MKRKKVFVANFVYASVVLVVEATAMKSVSIGGVSIQALTCLFHFSAATCYLLPIVKLPRQYKFCCSAFVLISVPQPSLREISITFLAISLSLPLHGGCVSIFKYTGKASQFSQAFASHRPSQNHGTVSSCTDHWINTQFGLCWPRLRKIPNYQLAVIVVFSHL